MLYIFRMLRLKSWHKAIDKKSPSKIKQRVKLRDIGIAATPSNPIMGSPLECLGTITEMYKDRDRFFVRWDNNAINAYPSSSLVIGDFPLKYIPKILSPLSKDNPNVTFKELEQYKEMEMQWRMHELNMRERALEKAKEAAHFSAENIVMTIGGRR